MCSFQIGNKCISNTNDDIYIIAEIGQNHQGSIDIAKQMILEAKRIGCDCVKFQKSCLNAKFTKKALDRRYDGENSWGKTYGEHKEYLEFSLEQYQELQAFSKETGIDFTASAMDEVSLGQLNEMDVPFIKIGSGDANNFPLLQKAATFRRPLVISTGMQTAQTIDEIVRIMSGAEENNYSLLHCVSSYPTDPEDCNLQQILNLKRKYPHLVIGYSGHEKGIEISKAAVLLGARIIERHFTLDKMLKGSDHKCSLLPGEFQKLITEIRTFQQNGLLKNVPWEINQIVGLLGNNPDVKKSLAQVGDRSILQCELNCKNKLGKSVVCARPMAIGDVLLPEDLCIKVSEPNGIAAENYKTVVGKSLKCDLDEDEAIQYEFLQ